MLYGLYFYVAHKCRIFVFIRNKKIRFRSITSGNTGSAQKGYTKGGCSEEAIVIILRITVVKVSYTPRAVPRVGAQCLFI
jgi:hypothetical protein